MSRMKSIFVVLLLTAIVSLVPLAQAVTPEVTAAGSSAIWQATALAAFKIACPTYPAACATSKGIQAGHWTSASNTVNLLDTRVSPANSDAGTLWIVWNAGATKVWSYNKVDSVVGDRCYFASPRCTVIGSLTAGEAGAGQISQALWGPDAPAGLPLAVAQLFSAGTPVNTAATDIRPEDAAFAACRVNSALGAGTNGGASSDGLDGIGYNPNNPPGACPANGQGQASGLYVGTPIKSGYPGSAATANVLSFNITGVDPITGDPIPAFTVLRLGLDPMIFVYERATKLASLTTATDKQLQQAFGGLNCDASAFGLTAGGINVFLREPLSGTYNTIEATIFRHPVVYPGAVTGVSQETGVNAPVNNPLAGQAGTCTSSDGKGARYRGIGTGEVVKAVLNSSSKFPNGLDGITYTFFSYGNVSSLASQANYGYLQLSNVDPIFASYAGGDPGQPATAGNPDPGTPGTIPGAKNLPAACPTGFPCPESAIWAGGLSFPNVRAGDYQSWSIVRLVSNGTALTAAQALIKATQAYVVSETPDYIPISKTTVGAFVDPGLLLLRSHYQQYDGAGVLLGAAPVNKGTTEAGGDMGGCILKSSGATSTKTQLVAGDYPDYIYPNCVTRP